MVGQEQVGLNPVATLDGPDDTCCPDDIGVIVGKLEANRLGEAGHAREKYLKSVQEVV